MRAFRAVSYFSLSYIVLALSSAVTNLSNKTLIFHDFPWPTIEFHDFPGLEMKFLNSMTFHDLTNPGQCFVAGNDVHTKVIPRTIRGYAMDP